jgi:hypothetical protein
VKELRWTVWTVTFLLLLILSACDGGGGGGELDVSSPTSSEGASFGTLSMNITDAKPVLPEGTVNVWITFEEVLAHASGAGWISLPLAQTPYTIELTQFYSGNTTELVPPVSLESGKYTQMRIVVSSAMITIDDGVNVNDYTVTIPSESLKTDKNFPFEVVGGGAVHLTVDFDLSQSIVVTGQQPPSYELKPVLHIVDTAEAATIRGSISATTFDANSSSGAIITVIWDKDGDTVLSGEDEEYTKVQVQKAASPAEFTEFNVFWLVPNQGYMVEIDMDADSAPEFDEFVGPGDLERGSVYDLNDGAAF